MPPLHAERQEVREGRACWGGVLASQGHAHCLRQGRPAVTGMVSPQPLGQHCLLPCSSWQHTDLRRLEPRAGPSTEKARAGSGVFASSRVLGELRILCGWRRFRQLQSGAWWAHSPRLTPAQDVLRVLGPIHPPLRFSRGQAGGGHGVPSFSHTRLLTMRSPPGL